MTAVAEPVNPTADVIDTEMFTLEGRLAEILEEAEKIEERLRVLRTANDLCPKCGGKGKVNVRGGLYGERKTKNCSCTKP
jgi:hypothetical protein